MFFTADQLVAHGVGDYLLQSHWMATEKVRHHLPAAVHAVTYGLPFVLLTRRPAALAVIVVTHFVIDRWRLARWVVWARNHAAPLGHPAVAETYDRTGFPAETPQYLAVWLLIIADNLMHVVINGAALHWL